MTPAMRRPRARLVCVGSELLAGQVNTHQAWLSVRLRRAGFMAAGEESVPDSVPAIAAAISRALSCAEAVIVCGGLGPTFDDLTREAAAAALGRTLRFDSKQWARIRRRFARYKIPVPDENRRQAEVISGAAVLANDSGSAPGQRLELRGRGAVARSLLLLPGPHAEMAPMFLRALPRLRARHARGLFSSYWTLRLTGVPESVADERLDPVRSLFPEAEFTILASGGELSFHAAVNARSAAAARGELARLRRAALGAVGRWRYAEGEKTLEEAAGAALKTRKLTVATAESCTGGLIAARLTNVPGSSAYFKGGVIAYADEVKTRRLGVPRTLLRRHGAVSAPCAAAMARGARRTLGASIGLAATGIAGPGGGTKKKPVGLVYIAAAGPGPRLELRRLYLNGLREAVRARAATAALDLLRRAASRRSPP